MNSPTNVEYDSDQTSAMNALIMRNKKNGTGQGGITGFVISKGLVKNEKAAVVFLVGFSLVLIIVAIYFLKVSLKKPVLNPIVRVITVIK